MWWSGEAKLAMSGGHIEGVMAEKGPDKHGGVIPPVLDIFIIW